MLLQALCSISHPLVNSNWSYSPETPNLGQIRRFLAPCDLEIWRMALKNNREPLLSNMKLYVSFRHHMWIQTGVTVRKRLSWVVTSVTLTGVTDRQTDRQTDRRTENTIHRAAWSQLIIEQKHKTSQGTHSADLSYSEKAWACVQNGITQRGRLVDGDMTTSP